MRKHFCLTIGDPTGVGPEITAKLLQNPAHYQHCSLSIVGNIHHLEETAAQYKLSLPTQDALQYVSIQANKPGEVAYQALDYAAEQLKQGKAQGLVTGPISKENLHQAGFKFSGHTEILEYFAQRDYQQPCQADMLFVYQQFRMLLLTRHVALKEVGNTLTKEGVSQSLTNLVSFLNNQQQITHPGLCMLGVNPHAGEVGGSEEKEILIPVIERLNQTHPVSITNPLSADGVFRGFDINHIPYDAYIAAYHDQGLIPFKLVAGLKAINVTIGLPFLRTSVSHGTAPDIVGQGIADEQSLMSALALLQKLTP